MSCRVVSSFRSVPALPLPVGKDEQDLGRITVGGRCLRSLIEGVFALWCASGYLFPRAIGNFGVVKMHVSRAHAIEPELSRNSPTLNPKLQSCTKSTSKNPISISFRQSDSKFRNAAREIGPDDF